ADRAGGPQGAQRQAMRKSSSFPFPSPRWRFGLVVPAPPVLARHLHHLPQSVIATVTHSGHERTMRYLVLACDYDGTLAHDGRVDQATLAALERLRASGRELILVSGRQLEDLQSVFDHLDLFALDVLENGGLLYRPSTREEKVLGPAPPEAFLDSLRRRGVK